MVKVLDGCTKSVGAMASVGRLTMPAQVSAAQAFALMVLAVSDILSPMRNFFRTLVLTALAAMAMNAADCDRACMKGLLTRYLDALVAHKPESLPLAKNVRFTEDSKDLKLGEGLWTTAAK